MTTGKTIALSRWTFVDKVMSLLSFFFFFKLYKIGLVLPNIKMNPPQEGSGWGTHAYLSLLLNMLSGWS